MSLVTKARDRLAWLLDFAQMTPEQIAALPTRRFSALQRAAYLFPRGMQIGEGGGPASLTVNGLGKLAGRVGEAVRYWSGGRAWRVRLSDFDFGIHLLPGTDRPIRYVGDHTAAFLLEAIQLLAAESHWIRCCASPRCRRVFAARKRGAYCSKRCSQRERTARFRKRKLNSRTEMASAMFEPGALAVHHGDINGLGKSTDQSAGARSSLLQKLKRASTASISSPVRR